LLSIRSSAADSANDAIAIELPEHVVIQRTGPPGKKFKFVRSTKSWLSRD